jgi:outer membrane protein assembly complex protein YaeT
MSAVAVPPAYALAAVLVLISLTAPAVAQSPQDADVRPLAVRSLAIHGVSDVDVAEIKRVLVTRVSGSLPLVGRDRFFDRRQFQEDLYRVVAYLSDHGYPRARVASVDIDEDVERGDVHLTVHVEQGAPVIIDRVQTYGFDVLPERDRQAVDARIRIREGTRRVQSDVRATQAATLAILQERGYAHSAVTVLETDGAAPGSVRLIVVADPGPLTTFGPITISGNGAVSDGRVRSLLTFREGDVFSLSRIQESQRRLYARDVFQFVTMDVAHGDGTSPEVPVHVRLTQARRYRVSVAPGYGSEEQARVTGTFSNVNLFGGARSAAVQTKWSSLDRGARVNFDEPSLFRRGVGLGASVQYWYANEPAYSLLTSGGRLTLARELSRSDPVRRKQALTTVSTTFVHEYEDYAISDFALEDLTFRDEIIALGLDPTRGTGGGTLVALGFDIQHNTTPNLIDARQGYLVNFHVEQAGRWLPGDFNYIEYRGEGRYYATVAHRAVLAGRIRMGTISAPGTLPANVPFFKRYFLGGATSLRGWGRFQVGPLSGSGLPIGGHSFLESSLEARLPVRGALSSVVFLDAGNAWSDSFDFQVDDLRYALGTGIRYLTPIGPVRFDIGYQLNPIATLLVDGRPETRRWRLHFSIGQAF